MVRQVIQAGPYQLGSIGLPMRPLMESARSILHHSLKTTKNLVRSLALPLASQRLIQNC